VAPSASRLRTKRTPQHALIGNLRYNLRSAVSMCYMGDAPRATSRLQQPQMIDDHMNRRGRLNLASNLSLLDAIIHETRRYE